MAGDRKNTLSYLLKEAIGGDDDCVYILAAAFSEIQRILEGDDETRKEREALVSRYGTKLLDAWENA